MKWIKSNLHILVVLIAGILASRTLLFQSGYFNMHDDLQMMRQLSMEKCLLDLQIPCRWIPDMGYGYGFPLFNFYPPLPYLVGEIFRILQFSFVDTAKITFALSFIVSGVTMYYLAKEFFGKFGGVVSSVFYIWAPYHSVDVYVRGAMNESWALVFFPLIFLFSYKLIHLGGAKAHPRGVQIALALSYAGLLLSHNLMVLIFTPVFALWCFLWIWRLKKNLVSSIKYLVSSGLFALGLSAFFTIPAIIEQKFVRVDTLVVGYYEYIAHFASLKQLLFSRFWGYGPSIWGEADGMPFRIGHIHWIASLVIGGWWLVTSLRKKKFVVDHISFIVPFLFAVGWFALFMAHSRSTPIWQMFKPLEFVQFPWRFLTLSTLSFSFIAGSVLLIFKNETLQKFIGGGLVLGVIAFNWNYFLPLGGKMGPLTDEEKFKAAAWDLQRTAGIYDYLPKSAKFNPKDGQNVLAEVIEGKADLTEMSQGTNWGSFNVKVEGEKALVRINIFEFPNWKVSIDEMEVKEFIPDAEEWGRMYIEIPGGDHNVYLKLKNTPVRTMTNIISLITWFLLLRFLIWKKGIISR